MPFQIALVEDHAVMRRAYAHILHREPDCDLSHVFEDAESLDRVLGQMECDIVLMDLSLPGMGGIEMLARIGVVRPDIHAIVVSAHQERFFVLQAQQAGACAYLTKRDLAVQLAPAIRRVMKSASRTFFAPGYSSF